MQSCAYSRDPYSFFIKFVSWASKPDDTFARAKFGLPYVICRVLTDSKGSEEQSSTNTLFSGQ